MSSSMAGDGYEMIGLVQRKIRWDVIPFLVWYILARNNELWFLFGLVSHVGIFLCQQWNIYFATYIAYRKVTSFKNATHVLVVPPSSQQELPEIVPMTRQSKNNDVLTCTYHDIVFRYGDESSTLSSLWNFTTPSNTTKTDEGWHKIPFPLNYPCTFYHSRLLANCKDGNFIALSKKLFGWNETIVKLPSLAELVQEQCLAPLFLFQLACVGLWSLDEYWYYAIFTLFTLLLFECTVAYQRLRNLQNMQHSTDIKNNQYIWVQRCNKWTLLPSSKLVVGDIVSLSSRDDTSNNNNRIPADIVLLSGTAVVNEAMLTGESVPRSKQSLPNHSTELLEMKEMHSSSILFGGTTLVNHTAATHSSTNPNRGCCGMVIRVGFETQQGSLLRTMIHTSGNKKKQDVDSIVFIGILFLCALGACMYLWQREWNDVRRNKFQLVLHIIIILTSVVPPELPMELNLAITSNLSELIHQHSITCTEPHRIPLAGQVTTCAFDKTGTLTSDAMIPSAIRTTDTTGDNITEEVYTDVPRNTMVEKVIVGCHSLSVVSTSGEMMGDPLEKSMFQHAQTWTITKHRNNDTTIVANGQESFQILKVFPFTSKLKRMSVFISSGNEYFVLTKGAPEIIQKYLKKVPDNYAQVVRHHELSGQRVLALAYKKISSTTGNWSKTTQQEVECNLDFGGLIALDCPLKPKTRTVLKSLQTSGLKTIMITGDALYTAAHVAKQVKILSSKKKQYQFSMSNNAFALVPLFSQDETDAIAYTPSNVKMIRDLVVKEQKIQVSATGQVVTSFLQQNPNDFEFLSYISVFARHAPRQKEAVIFSLNKAGEMTLMCGDGTNDVGALKMAHVGISLLSIPQLETKLLKQKKKKRKKKQSLMESLQAMQEAEQEMAASSLGDASVASPFTSRTMSIKCTKDVLQRGRCTLVTMLQIYKILGVNCLVNAMVLTTLHLVGAKQGDRQLTAVGFIIAFLFYFITKGQPLNELSPKRPPSTVLCLEALMSIAIQFFIHFSCIQLIGTMASLLIDPYEPSYNVPDGPFHPTILNTVTFLMTVLAYINTFVVNYRGRPFMENLTENKVLLRTLQGCYAILLICTLEIFPPLNQLLQLVPLPPDVESTKYFLSLSTDSTTDHHPILDFFVTQILPTFGFKPTICFFMILDFIGVYISQKTILHIFDS